MTQEFTALGKRTSGPVGAEGLESFPRPDHVESVTFETNEVTSFCPITGQPDFYRVEITYQPHLQCLESKSLKLYLWSFRDQAMFAEALTALIAADIFKAIAPRYIMVQTRQQPRGGLELKSIAELP